MASNETLLYLDHDPQHYLPLSDEQSALVEAARSSVYDALDLDVAQAIVNGLNMDFSAQGLVGSDVLIQAEMSYIAKKSMLIQKGQIFSSEKPEIVSSQQYQGMLLGFAVQAFDSGRFELVVVVELPVDTTELQSQTLVAPVDAAELLVKRKESVDAAFQADALRNFSTLTNLDHPEVRPHVRYLMDLMETTDTVDADYLSEIAYVVVEIMAHPSVRDIPEVQEAVLRLIAACIDTSVYYGFEGLNFERAQSALGTRISMDAVEGVGKVTSVTLIKDFNIIESTKTTPSNIEFNDGLQPTLFVQTGEDSYTHLPLKNLKQFYIQKYGENYEQEWRERFSEMHPYATNPDVEQKYFKLPKNERIRRYRRQ